MSNQPHRTQPDRKPPPAQNSQSDPNSPPLPGPRPADGHPHRGHRQNFGPQLTDPDRSHRKRSKPRSHGPGPRGGPPRFKLQPLFCPTSLSHHPDPGSRRAVNTQGLGSWRRRRGFPGSVLRQAKGWPALWSWLQWASGSVRAQGTCQIPFSCESSPMGTRQVMFMGWMDAVTENVHSNRWGWLGGCTEFSSAGAGGVPDRNRKQCLGESPAGRGGSPALRTRTGQGTQHRP